MNKWITVFAVALACAGCFDNKGKPEDVPTVVGLKALASTNRTGIVRVILRGDKGALTADMLTNLDAVKMGKIYCLFNIIKRKRINVVSCVEIVYT